MRRSKSNPAKYSRNYKSISQRRMTNKNDDDEDDDEKEMERLRTILKQSSTQIQQQKDIEESKKNKNIIEEEDNDNDNYYDNDDDDIIMLPSKKKKKKTSSKIELTPEELRRAKLAQKNANRKLKQLEVRATQKRKRAELYTKLQQSSITMEERRLLSSSSTLGKRETKKETLKRLLQKERAGMVLTEDEKDMLYTTRRIVSDSDITNIEMKKVDDDEDMDSSNVVSNNQEENNVDSTSKKKKKKKKKKKQKVEEGERSNNGIDVEKQLQLLEESKSKNDAAADDDDNSDKNDDAKDDVSEEKDDDDEKDDDEEAKTTTTAVSTTTNENTTTTTPINFAAQMMASLTQLKTKIEDEKPDNTEEIVPSSELERIALDEEKRHKDVIYKPSNPVLVQTAAQMGLKGLKRELKKVMEIKRPPEIEKKRYELPISSMEYEIIDAITNHSVTILCSETGSGKSTQVPQFLYEAGFTLDDDDKEKDNSYVIGITQPRRVAAVSTAKRVCYEMGFGNGQVIGKNNTVAYQTRYESAGLSDRTTKIKFMTDGILLQEIQSDLLLRKYSVIVLDEAHERNLNTDVLLGLLSVSIPLRMQASKEDSTSKLKPLKVIIMSATLRIEDFTKNDKLFSTEKPAIVRVPGRTHPVTIHHSRITELDKYEDVAYRKIIKIHTKLPKGGILVFLTGKQEIVRMVNKLRRRFNKKKDHRKLLKADDDIIAKNAEEQEHLRDMDDDDMDGDIFNDNIEEEDDFDNLSDGEDEEKDIPAENNNEDNDNIPKNVLVLPLHSMLSVEEQAKVFAPVPENTRLIVVATNIAETSITIPNISYVVDTGRHKCRNYSATTGVASYDIMWISRAAADQRAGRAGRTGPGHCYRLYSSALYSRTMESFALPEVLTRPLEDVVLAMKAMNITHVSKFPFPTPPDKSQIHGAVRLLANLGCITLEDDKNNDTKYDGHITRLGSAVAKLPLGVRYGKMLLVAAQAGVLDYGIVMVALLSENSPFLHGQKENISDENEKKKKKEGDDDDDSDSDSDSSSSSSDEEEETKESRKEILQKWKHRGGDVLAGLLAVGAYSYAGKNAGGMTEKLACRKFCETNGLNFAIMVRIHKMRLHLSKLAKARLSSCDGIAARTGGIVYDMRPPNKLQENLILQAVCSGLLDRIAMLAPPGSFANAQDNPSGYRSAYVSCIATMKDPLFVDANSAVHTRDFRSLPTWVCFDTMIRKKNKTTGGKDMVIMKRISPIDANWIGPLSTGSKLLQVGEPISTPVPSYDIKKDEIVCSVQTKFGTRGWEIPSLKSNMYIAITNFPKNKAKYVSDDSYRYFARFLLEGKVVPEIPKVAGDIGWNDDPAIITRNTPIRKVALLVSDLSSNGIDTLGALRKHWATIDKTFLSKTLLSNWINMNLDTTMKHNWMTMIQKQIEIYNTKNGILPEKKKKKKKKRKRKSE